MASKSHQIHETSTSGCGEPDQSKGNDKDQGAGNGNGQSIRYCQETMREPFLETLVVCVTDLGSIRIQGAAVPIIYAFSVDPDGDQLQSNDDTQQQIFALDSIGARTYGGAVGCAYVVRFIPANQEDKNRGIEGGTIKNMVKIGLVNNLYRMMEITLEILDAESDETPDENEEATTDAPMSESSDHEIPVDHSPGY